MTLMAIENGWCEQVKMGVKKGVETYGMQLAILDIFICLFYFEDLPIVLHFKKILKIHCAPQTSIIQRKSRKKYKGKIRNQDIDMFSPKTSF